MNIVCAANKPSLLTKHRKRGLSRELLKIAIQPQNLCKIKLIYLRPFSLFHQLFVEWEPVSEHNLATVSQWLSFESLQEMQLPGFGCVI